MDVGSAVGWVVLLAACGTFSGVGEGYRRWQRGRREHQVALERERGKREKAALEAKRGPEPICGCSHHLAKHDKIAGRCHEIVQAAVEWNNVGKATKFVERQCNCQQYIGPEPLTQIFAPEIADL